MTTERWDDEKLDKLAAIVQQSIVSSDERMTRIEQQLAASNDRLTCIEQVVESNNRFLESFSQDIKTYTDSMNNIATRMDGIIATTGYDRQDVSSLVIEDSKPSQRDRQALRRSLNYYKLTVCSI